MDGLFPFPGAATNILPSNGTGTTLGNRPGLRDQTRAIYLIQGEGKKWSEGVDGENGNYDFLIFNDVDFDHPRWSKK